MGRTPNQCNLRWKRLQPFKNRERWTNSEDKLLFELVAKHGFLILNFKILIIIIKYFFITDID